MLKEYYNQLATYLMETFDANFIFLIFVLTTAASIAYFIMISYIITQMDTHYFVRKTISSVDASETPDLTPINSIVVYVINIAKIILGICLLVIGILMLVLPGQGLITIIIGLSLIPFPGKNQLEQNFLARKSVRSSLNWIRTKANKKPFIFD